MGATTEELAELANIETSVGADGTVQSPRAAQEALQEAETGQDRFGCRRSLFDWDSCDSLGNGVGDEGCGDPWIWSD